MKKFSIALLFVLGLSLPAFTGCGGGGSNEVVEAPTEADAGDAMDGLDDDAYNEAMNQSMNQQGN